MAVKSIIEVDIRDGRFREFKRLYDQYERALKSQPAAWKAVNDKIDGSKAAFDALVGKMAAANVQARLLAKAQEQADSMTRRTSERWAGIARSALSFATSLREITGSVMRMAGVTGVITGLIGAGGLYGIDRLAYSAAGARRGALGLGVGVGDLRAFGANFSRLVGPDFLENVAGAKFDINRRVGLLGAGLSQGEIAADTGTTAVALLRRLKQIADATDPQLFAQVIQARRLEVTPEELMRLRNTSRSELESQFQGFAGDRLRFNPPGDVSRTWQEFVTQLERAGQGIETTFVRGLAPLAPGLTKLSEGVEKVIAAFLNSPTLDRWIKTLDQGLEKLAGYIGTDEFAQKVEGFVEGIGQMADVLARFLPSVRTAANVGRAAGDVGRGLYGGVVTVPKAIVGGLRDMIMGYNEGGIAARFGSQSISIDQAMQVIRQRENSGDTATSPRGAVGRFQVEPKTATWLGYDPSRLKEPAYNEQVARAYVLYLVKRYHGNLSEVLASYNAGPGRGDRFRSAGDDPSVLPAETRRYISGSKEVTVRIDDNTGGNVNTSVNALKN